MVLAAIRTASYPRKQPNIIATQVAEDVEAVKDIIIPPME